MSKNLFAICITLIAIVLIIVIGHVMVAREDGDRVRNLLKLQQNISPYLKPNYEAKN